MFNILKSKPIRRKSIFMRALSILLVVSLTVTTVQQAVPKTAAAADGTLINNPLTLPVSIYNADSDTRSNVLGNLKANNSSPYDVKKYYKAYYTWPNVAGYMGKTLGSKISTSSNSHFEIYYYFNPPPEMEDAWKKGDYSVVVMYDSYKYQKKWTERKGFMGLGGSVTHTANYFAGIQNVNVLRTVAYSGYRDKANKWTTHGINRKTGQLTWLRGGPGTYSSNYANGYHYIRFWGDRSNTSLKNIGVQMKDAIGPSVTGAYVLKGTGNPDKPYIYGSAYDTVNFPRGSTAYIAVQFDEPVRIKQGTDLSTLKLNLNTISNIDNTTVEQKADFFALDSEDGGGGKRIVFKYTVPEGADLRLSDLDIENSNFITGKAVLDLPGNEMGKNTSSVKFNKIKELTGRLKTVYFDSIVPTVNRTNLTISTSRQIITNGSSATGLYYTAGDELTFDLLFSETLDSTKFNTNDLNLVVNIGNDGPGPEKTRTISNPEFIKKYDISANARPGSALRFKYVIKEGDDTHEPVKAVELTVGGSSKIVDLRQNEFGDYTSFDTPAQRIFIDTVKPTAMIEKYEYNPADIPDVTNPDMYGYYKITFNEDDFSTTEGVEGYARLWYYNNESDKSDGKAIDYMMGSFSPSFPSEPKGMTYTGSPVKVPEIPGTPYYVHYKLPDNAECQNVDINLSIYDLAGNVGAPAATSRVIIDKTNPVINIEDRTAYSIVEPFPSNFDAYITIEDNSSTMTNYTQWTENGTAYDESGWVQVLDYPVSSKEFASLHPIADAVNNKTLWVKSVDDKGNSSIESRQFLYDGRALHYNLVFNDSPSRILANHDIGLKVAPDTEFYYQWVKKGQIPDEGKYITVSGGVTTPTVVDVTEVKLGDDLGFTGVYQLYHKAENIESGLESIVTKNEFSFSNVQLGADGEVTVNGEENFVNFIKRTFDDVYFTLSINDKTFGGNKTVDYGSAETYYKMVDGSGNEIFKKPLPPLETSKLTFPSDVFKRTGADYKAVISVKSVGSDVPYTTEFSVAIEKNTFATGGLTGISGDPDGEVQSIPVEEAGNPVFTNITGPAYLNFRAVSDEKEPMPYSGYLVRVTLDPNELVNPIWYQMSSAGSDNGGNVVYKNTDSITVDLPVGDTVIYYQFLTPGGYATELRSTIVHVDSAAPDGELMFDFGDANNDNTYPAIKRQVTLDTGNSKSISYVMDDTDKFVNNSPVTVRLQNISDNLSSEEDLDISVSAYIRGQKFYAYDAAQNNLRLDHTSEDGALLPNADGSYTFDKEGYIQVSITDQSGNVTQISSEINWIRSKAVEFYDGPEAGYYTYDTFEDFDNADIDTFKEGLLDTPEGNFAVTAVTGDYAAGEGESVSASDVYFAFNKEYQSRLENNGGTTDDEGLVWYRAGDTAPGVTSTYGHKSVIGSVEDGLGQYFTLKGQFQYDSSVPEGDTVPIKVYVKAKDLAGHETEVKEVNITPKNIKPSIKEHYYSPEEGYVIKFNEPVTLLNLNSDKNGSSSMVHKNVSIYHNGNYNIKFTDVFGNEYEEAITASVFDSIYEHDVEVSPDTPTNTTVTVTLSTRDNEGLYIDADTISGGEVKVSGDSTVSGITGNVCTGAAITMTENGNVSYTLKSTKTGVADREVIIPINNIDTSAPAAEVEYIYFAPIEQTAISGKTVYVTYDQVVAQLVNESEPVTMLNGDISYTFAKGSAGDTYTFEFKDSAGNIGTATAVLPVDIVFPEVVDTTPPDYSLKFMSQNVYGINMMDDYSGEQYRSDVTDGKFSLNPVSGKILIDVLPVDETEVTVALKDKANGVTLNGNRLTFTEDASCSVILTDTAGNITEVSITIDRVIDNVAPTAEFDYAAHDRNIRAYITVSDNLSKSDDIIIKKNIGVEYDSVRNQYYYEFDKNGVYTFEIMDQAGNTARPQAIVGGIDNTTLKAEFLKWMPSLSDDYPKEQYNKVTNINVKAIYSLSKPVKKVEVTPASAYDKVSVNFTADTLITEFKQNAKVALTLYDYSDNTFTIDVPEVKSIDKNAPKITVSLDPPVGLTKKVKAVFTSDKPVILTSDAVAMDSGGEIVYKTEYERVINQNGSYVSTFVDEAGNIAAAEFNVSSISTAPPNVYVLGVPHSGAFPTNSDIELKVVSTRDGTVYFNNKPYAVKGTDARLEGNTIVVGDMSKALDIKIGINGRYFITVEDNFSNRASTYFDIKNIDKAPPVISIASPSMVEVRKGTSLAELDAEALKDVAAFDRFDNVDLTPDISVGGITEENLNTAGIYTLNYTVSDAAGNEASAIRKVYVYDADAMAVEINGAAAAQYNTSVVNTRQILVSTNISGPEYKMYYKKGYNTIGEMKDARVFDDSFTAPDRGYYTIVVKTQERVYGIYYIYVDVE